MKLSLLLLISLISFTVQAADEKRRFEIDFEGGNALDFVDALEEMEINVILPDNADSIQIPTVKLSNVTADKLFRALSIVGEQAPLQFEWKRSGGGFPTVIGPDGGLIGDSSPQIWVLEQTGSHKTAQPFAVGHLLESGDNTEGYTVDDITSAIDATVEASATASGRTSEIEFQYHEGTELLIITGMIEDINVAQSTLTTLRESLQAKRMGQTFGGLLNGFGVQGLIQPDN